ncbi:MAG: MDR family MFS transporter [bacterium]|nr:MDR family MFS transporter [bacterium]MDE0352915.1 MDR family MFS transporter [bacterium]
MRRTFIALLLAMAIAAMDYTIVSTALPTIVGEMGALTLLPWVLTANVLASTVTVPLYGKLSDIYGRRRLMQVAILLFTLGSCAAGLSQSIGQLIACRAVQGAGSAGLISLSYMIVGDMIPPRQRGRYQVYISAVFAVTSVCGPLLGGLAVDHVSWRLAFYPSVLLAMITLTVIRRNLVDPPATGGIVVDWFGAALLAVGLAAVTMVASLGVQEQAWDSPVIIATTAIGVLALVWFVRQEGKAPSPILPLFLFRNREFSAVNATSFIAGFGLFLPLAYFPVFLQISLALSATNSGLLLVPMLTASLVASLVSGRMVARWGRYRSVVVAGSVLLGVGLALLSTMTVSTSPVAAAAYLVVFGLSMGILIPVLILVIQNSVHPRDLGVATSSVQVFRQLGGSTGVAVFGALFNARLAGLLAARLPPDSPASDLDVSELVASPAVVATMEAAVRDVIREAVALSSAQMFRLAIPVAVAATIAGLMLRGLPLRDVLPDQQPGAARSSEATWVEPTPPAPGEPS